jgi:hypothetical protein
MDDAAFVGVLSASLPGGRWKGPPRQERPPRAVGRWPSTTPSRARGRRPPREAVDHGDVRILSRPGAGPLARTAPARRHRSRVAAQDLDRDVLPRRSRWPDRPAHAARAEPDGRPIVAWSCRSWLPRVLLIRPAERRTKAPPRVEIYNRAWSATRRTRRPLSPLCRTTPSFQPPRGPHLRAGPRITPLLPHRSASGCHRQRVSPASAGSRFPPDGSAILTLVAPTSSAEHKLIGRATQVVLITNDVAGRFRWSRGRPLRERAMAAADQVRARPAATPSSPGCSARRRRFGGVFARFRDVDGNNFSCQLRRGDPSAEAARRASRGKARAERRAHNSRSPGRQTRLFPQSMPALGRSTTPGPASPRTRWAATTTTSSAWAPIAWAS